MHLRFSFVLFALVLSLNTFESRSQSIVSVYDIAKSAPTIPGAPGPADVCFSSRTKHPSGAGDPLDSIASAKAFHATSFVWGYLWGYDNDLDYVQGVKQMGSTFQATLNSYLYDTPGSYVSVKGRILDLNGVAVTAPWMRSWATPTSGSWGCVNSAEWRNIVLTTAKKLLSLGANSFQFDDPSCNADATAFGGCFCTNCMVGFREYLKSNLTATAMANIGIKDSSTFDYGNYLRSVNAPVGDAFRTYQDAIKPYFLTYQKQSVIAFHGWLQQQINASYGHIAFSANNSDGSWASPYDSFDFGIAELSPSAATPSKIVGFYQDSVRRGKKQLFTLTSSDVSLTRRVIGTSYACGSPMIVPWDIYIEGASRYYGSPADYGDLYKFVRDRSSYLTGYEDAAYVVPGLTDARYSTRLPVVISGASNCSAFVRVIPGNLDTPAVIHLVDWASSPAAFDLTIDKDRFDCSNPLKPKVIKLLRPGMADLNLSMTDLGQTLKVSVPALNPWGIVVVSKLPTAPQALRIINPTL